MILTQHTGVNVLHHEYFGIPPQTHTQLLIN